MSSNDSVGLTLQKQREARRVSIEAASRSTRIALKFLLAMEQERWEYLTTEVYRVGFLRRYADFLGLDAEALVQRLLRQRQQSQSSPVPPERTVQRLSLSAQRVLGSRMRVLFLGLVAGALGIVWLLVSHPAMPLIRTSLALRQAVTPTKVGVQSNVLDSRLRGNDGPKTVFQHSYHTLEVAAKEVTWLRVVADGTRLFEGHLPPQTSRRWTSGERYLVRIGNVRGMELRVDDQPIDVTAAARGNVAEVTLPQ
ncbi:MAG: DUF4115 domain-containing protein [Elusimicrobia bacterium]|nr:DUF4115 domain-containing protein [Elusimicrobiota bacterium]